MVGVNLWVQLFASMDVDVEHGVLEVEHLMRFTSINIRRKGHSCASPYATGEGGKIRPWGGGPIQTWLIRGGPKLLSVLALQISMQNIPSLVLEEPEKGVLIEIFLEWTFMQILSTMKDERWNLDQIFRGVFGFFKGGLLCPSGGSLICDPLSPMLSYGKGAHLLTGTCGVFSRVFFPTTFQSHQRFLLVPNWVFGEGGWQ